MSKKQNGNPSTRKPKAAKTTLVDLVRAMTPIIQHGDRDDREKNVAECAKVLGVATSTVRGKIRKYRNEVPQFRLLDSSFFLAGKGPQKETFNEQDLNKFFADILQKPVEEVAAAAEKIAAEMQTSSDEDASIAS